jgi:microcompartment protein CcmL/EutN
VRRAGDALGLLEVRGMTAALAAADAMAKAAFVAVGPAARIGDGLVTVAVHGDIAAAREALSAGASIAVTCGELVARHVIGRPSDGLVSVFGLEPGDRAMAGRPQRGMPLSD